MPKRANGLHFVWGAIFFFGGLKPHKYFSFGGLKPPSPKPTAGYVTACNTSLTWRLRESVAKTRL